MKRAMYIQREVDQIGTIEGLTSVFEAIASIHISQIKDKVMLSTSFFNELWQIYRQLSGERAKQAGGILTARTKRNALVVVTSDGGLIGDIDERIVAAMLEHGHQGADIYVIGAHGSALLAQHALRPTKVYPLPDSDTDFNVTPIVETLRPYQSVTVYYQTYISLLRQDIARIDLQSAVDALSQSADDTATEVISSKEYIFEPSIEEIVHYMESVMMEIALSQVVLESKLAQYASRFNAMTAAKTKARDVRSDLKLQLNRAKRGQSDERIKEIMSALKTVRHSGPNPGGLLR